MTEKIKEIEKQRIISVNIIKNRLLHYSEINRLSISAARERLTQFMQITKNQLTYWERNTSQPTSDQESLIQEFFNLQHSDLFIKKKY